MENKKPNILFLPKWYPHKEDEFYGIFVERHAQSILPHAAVYVVFPIVQQAKQKKIIEFKASEENGVNVLRYYFKKKITGLPFVDKIIKIAIYFYCCKLGYKHLVKQGIKINLVHVHVLLRAGLFARFLKWKTKTPYIITEHWTKYISGFSPLKKFLIRKVIKKSSAVTAVTRYLADFIQSIGGKEVRVIPNVVDTSFFKPVKKEATKVKKLLQVSDLNDSHKNISGLIDAAKLLQKRRDDFEISIVGEGPDKYKLIEKVKRLNLSDKIHFLGSKGNNELLSEYHKADILTLFSNHETFGVVLIEALSCGKPVVVSDLAPFKEFLDDTSAIFVEKGDVDGFAKALDHMLDNYHKYDADKLHGDIESKFSYQVVGNAFNNLYLEVLDKC